jgi:hypothetical protein
MVQRGEHFRLALKPRQPIRIAGERGGQDLERHLALQARVARAIDLPHASGTEGGHDFIGADVRARGEHALARRGLSRRLSAS